MTKMDDHRRGDTKLVSIGKRVARGKLELKTTLFGSEFISDRLG